MELRELPIYTSGNHVPRSKQGRRLITIVKSNEFFGKNGFSAKISIPVAIAMTNNVNNIYTNRPV